MKKNAIVFFCFLVVSNCNFAGKLIDVFNDALKNDQKFQAKITNVKIVKEQLPQAWADYLPQINCNYTMQYQKSSPSYLNQGDISLEQLLFSLGDVLEISHANSTIMQSKLELIEGEQDLLLRLINAYLHVIKAQENLLVDARQNKVLQEQFVAIKTKYKVNSATIIDLNRIKARLNIAETEKHASKILLDQAKASLQTITGQIYSSFPGLKFKADTFKYTKTPIKELHAKALIHNISYKITKIKEVIAKKKINIVKTEFLPTVVAKTSYTPSWMKSNNVQIDRYMFNLGIKQELFSGGKTFAKTREAKARLDLAKTNSTYVARNLETIIYQTFSSISNAPQLLSSARKAIIAAKSAYDNTKEGYYLGTQTVLDLLAQQQTLFDIERVYIEERINYLNNFARYQWALGTLSLDLFTQIETFVKN